MKITEENWMEEFVERFYPEVRREVRNKFGGINIYRKLKEDCVSELYSFIQSLITSIHEKHEKEIEAVRKEERLDKEYVEKFNCILGYLEYFVNKRTPIQNKADEIKEVVQESNEYIQSLTQEDGRCKPCQLEGNDGVCDRHDCSNHEITQEDVTNLK